MNGTSAPAVDATWLTETLLRILQTPSSVPRGQAEIEPGDPMITRAIDETVVPIIDALGPDELRRHPLGDIAARFGPPGDAGLLVQTYIVSQHGNLMDDALAGRLVEGATVGLHGPSAVGQGANQNKGPMAAVLAAVRDLPRDLRQPVWVTVNTEGRSSHGGSRRLLDDLGVTAAYGIVSIGTDLAVSLGNRGRVDVLVKVAGRSSHSSQPWLGSNPIEGVADVVTALRSVALPPPHPALGPAAATPYRVTCAPIAPHTIPSEAVVVVDRRLLPGEEPAGAVAALRAHLGTCVEAAHTVDEGPVMLPAAVDAAAPHVTALRAAVEELGGRESPAVWSRNTFDAGYACARGIPTLMFGPGRRDFAAGVTATEAVALSDCHVAAGALQRTFLEVCGGVDGQHRTRSR